MSTLNKKHPLTSRHVCFYFSRGKMDLKILL